MKREPSQRSLAIVLSCFILIFPAYLCFSSLSEIDVFSTEMGFENTDQDYQIADPKYGSDTPLVVVAFPPRFLPGLRPLKQFYQPYFPKLSLDQKACLLRC